MLINDEQVRSQPRYDKAEIELSDHLHLEEILLRDGKP